jgi:hypothetical protein
MVTKEEIEGFLDRLSASGGTYKEVENGLWVVKPGGSLDFNMVVHYSPPVAVLRVKVMELPSDKSATAQLTRRLLEMNASEMVHGSYGIEQNAVVITEGLELSHLDFEEFLAAYESITLALASHLREIGTLGTSGTHRIPALARKKNGKPTSASSKRNGKKAGGKKSARKTTGSRGSSRGRR